MTTKHWSDYVGAGAQPHPDDKQLAANVAHLRKAHRLTQKQLADAMADAGQSAWRQTTVSRVENGQQRLTGADLLALQEILGTAVLDGTDAAQLMAASFPQVRDQAAARALAEAERALQQALDTVQRLRELYKEGDDGDR